ncbi:hypothetical protein DO71_5258 [Burkholderia pseudomallei]|nr:hypothetical protein DO71_5258 [Burkholderia pseudomallei]
MSASHIGHRNGSSHASVPIGSAAVVSYVFETVPDVAAGIRVRPAARKARNEAANPSTDNSTTASRQSSR